MRNIKVNNKVAIAIYPGTSLPDHKVAGIQMTGVAQVVSSNERERVNDLYFTRVEPTIVGNPDRAK